MFNKILKVFYLHLTFFINKLRCFIIPNLFSKATYSYEDVPTFQQKVFITGKGKVLIGKNCAFGYKPGGFHYGGSIEIQVRTTDATIIIGDGVTTNNNIFICSSNEIRIGNNTLIGQNVTIMDFEAHGIAPNQRKMIGEIGKVTIHENVWIGNNVTILKNTEVGKNTIVAAGAIVSGVFPENVIIGGVPAKIIKKL